MCSQASAETARKDEYMDILIVEDDHISRSMLKKMLSEMGHTVIEASDGTEGWEILKQKKIKLVISDWIMPGMNGLDLCYKIRSGVIKEYIYVIMLTSKDRKTDLVNVFQAGADDYIPKPFDPEELRARVMTGVRVIDLELRHHHLANTLLESRNKLRIVIDSLKEEIVSLDQQMNIVSVNRAFANRLKCQPEDAVKKNLFSEDLSENSLLLCDESVHSMVTEVFTKGVGLQKLLTGKDVDGQTIYRQVSCLPIRDEFDHVFQVLIVAQDVTEEKRRTEEINSLNMQLIETSAKIEAQNKELKKALKRIEETQTQMLQSEKMASIGQLAAGVAHEINNPTGFVSSNLKTLLDYQSDIAQLIEGYRELVTELENDACGDKAPDRVRKNIEKVKSIEREIDIDFLMEDIGDLIGDCREGTDRIKKIVIDLKDFAHPGEDAVQSVDINSGLDSTLNVVNNEIKYKATVQRDFQAVPIIKGYPQQLNQVFMNILVNAAQAIEKRGEITIRTCSKDDFVEVAISDTGCGIPARNLKKIFDPFYTTKDVGKGTGLGMNIAYNIIQKHKGTIDVQSEVGKGTTFTIRLPVNAFDDEVEEEWA